MRKGVIPPPRVCGSETATFYATRLRATRIWAAYGVVSCGAQTRRTRKGEAIRRSCVRRSPPGSLRKSVGDHPTRTRGTNRVRRGTQSRQSGSPISLFADRRHALFGRGVRRGSVRVDRTACSRCDFACVPLFTACPWACRRHRAGRRTSRRGGRGGCRRAARGCGRPSRRCDSGRTSG